MLIAAIMDCSVCLESITQTTGQANLSCGHVFHFGCLARWILTHNTCPYCRHETNQYESIQENENEEEEDDEDETLSEAESESIAPAEGLRWVRVGQGRWRIFTQPSLPEFNEEEHAFWVFRNFFGSLEESQPVPPVGVKEPHIPYSDLLQRHFRLHDVAEDRGYDSA